MKAWICTPYGEFYSIVVFAETKGKAKSYALKCDGFENDDFLSVEVYRFKKADCMYKNRYEMEWENSDDRLFLVKECGFHCDEDYADLQDCRECVAKDFCDLYKEWLESEAEI